MAETSPKGINKGFSYSRTKRFCENKMKAGQKGIIIANNKEKQ